MRRGGDGCACADGGRTSRRAADGDQWGVGYERRALRSTSARTEMDETERTKRKGGGVKQCKWEIPTKRGNVVGKKAAKATERVALAMKRMGRRRR